MKVVEEMRRTLREMRDVNQLDSNSGVTARLRFFSGRAIMSARERRR